VSDLVLEVVAADKSFDGRSVLHNASVWAYAGEVTVLLGRNGCGKTTLLRIATGFVRPDAGTVRFRGVWHPRPRLHRLAQQGLAFAPAMDFLPWDRPLGQLLTLSAWPAKQAEAAARAHEIAEDLALGALLDQTTDELSGGERRRAEIACALARRPSCLVADEPFRGIAPTDCENLTRVFRRAAANGAAVVLTGHEITWMLPVADRVIWCHDGTTDSLGTPQDASSHDLFRAQYLGPH
jgi:ABC-type multidrug transport system ATPase subunit